MIAFLSFIGTLLAASLALLLLCGIFGLFGIAVGSLYLIIRFGLAIAGICFLIWLIMKLAGDSK